MSLIEALAQVKGLRNDSADDGGIFLFRFEDSRLAAELTQADRSKHLSSKALDSVCNNSGVETQGVLHVPETACLSSNSSAQDQKAVIYRLDLGRAEAFFLAQTFKMRDKDVLYIAEDPSAEFARFISMVVSPLLGTARAASLQ